jgi:hypothetical protein
VRVFDRTSHRIDYTLTGIRTEQLTSSRAISNLIAGMRTDLKRQSQLPKAVGEYL